MLTAGQSVTVMIQKFSDSLIWSSMIRVYTIYHFEGIFWCHYSKLKPHCSNLSRSMTKSTISPVHPAKTQISLGICPVWSELSLCAHCVAKDPSFLQADSEDSEETGQMPRLIWVFDGRKAHFVGFSHEAAHFRIIIIFACPNFLDFYR